MTNAPGVFTMSLDTELAWGSFDSVGIDARADAFWKTEDVIVQLCELFDRYEVSATWGVVAHLLEDCTGTRRCLDRPNPGVPWVTEWYRAIPCASSVDRELWYAPEIIDTIQSCSTQQEVGLHGDTHLVLGASSRSAAGAEIRAAVETLNRVGISPESFIFPRNSIAHVDLLRENGLVTYRGRDARLYEKRGLPEPSRKLFRFAEELVKATPPTVVPKDSEGLVEIPGSQVFRPKHGGWQWTPSHSQSNRAIKGLDRAAETGTIFHLWFHPFNLALAPERLLGELERILSYAGKLREDGALDVLPMRDAAAEYREGRWAR